LHADVHVLNNLLHSHFDSPSAPEGRPSQEIATTNNVGF